MKREMDNLKALFINACRERKGALPGNSKWLITRMRLLILGVLALEAKISAIEESLIGHSRKHGVIRQSSPDPINCPLQHTRVILCLLFMISSISSGEICLYYESNSLKSDEKRERVIPSQARGRVRRIIFTYI